MAVALAALVLAAPAGARARCAHTHDAPGAGATLEQVRAAVLCLHNRVRARRGLRPLKANARLRRAAQAHTDEMVAAQYFSHTSRSGEDMVDRILDTGYARGQGWSLGENIAWGTGSLGTAASIQRGWMRSPGHRANILRARFREVGIGIAAGVPVRAEDIGATYTTDFGARY